MEDRDRLRKGATSLASLGIGSSNQELGHFSHRSCPVIAAGRWLSLGAGSREARPSFQDIIVLGGGEPKSTFLE